MYAYLICPVAFIATAVTASAYVWFIKPGLMIQFWNWSLMYKAGLKKKYVNVGKYQFCYSERGTPNPDKSSMVFIHGFSSSQEFWATLIQRLPRDSHIVLVDLPGHGATTTPSPEEELTPTHFAEVLHDFFQAANIASPFHIIGCSLGGAICLLYASLYPGDVERISAVCPAMKTPEQTEFMKEVENGEGGRLIPTTAEEVKRMLDSVMYTKPQLNKQFLEGICQVRKPKNQFFTRLFQIISEKENHNMLISHLPKIKAQTQIVWGRHDELIHVSGVEILREHMDCIQRVDIIERCGHSVTMDRPGQFIKCLLEFRGELQSKSKSQ